MTIDIIPLAAMALGIYLVLQVEKQKSSGSSLLYAFAGIIPIVWSLTTVMGVRSIAIGSTPVLFGIFAIGSMYTKGNTQAISGAVAVLLFLAIIA